MSSLVRLSIFVPLLVLSCVEAPDLPKVELNEEFYGECVDEYGRTLCKPEEAFCDAYPDPDFPELAVCTSECETAADCPQPNSGDATVVCSGEPKACVLECASGETCPDGMECAPTNNCMWRG